MRSGIRADMISEVHVDFIFFVFGIYKKRGTYIWKSVLHVEAQLPGAFAFGVVRPAFFVLFYIKFVFVETLRNDLESCWFEGFRNHPAQNQSIFLQFPTLIKEECMDHLFKLRDFMTRLTGIGVYGANF